MAKKIILLVQERFLCIILVYSKKIRHCFWNQLIIHYIFHKFICNPLPTVSFCLILGEYFHNLDMCSVIYRPKQSGSQLLLYYAQSFQHQVKGELTNSNENAFMEGYYSLVSSKFQVPTCLCKT